MSDWAAIHRYRSHPVTVVTLSCGHLRWVEGGHDPEGLLHGEAVCRVRTCRPDQSDLRYITGAGVIW